MKRRNFLKTVGASIATIPFVKITSATAKKIKNDQIKISRLVITDKKGTVLCETEHGEYNFPVVDETVTVDGYLEMDAKATGTIHKVTLLNSKDEFVCSTIFDGINPHAGSMIFNTIHLTQGNEIVIH